MKLRSAGSARCTTSHSRCTGEYASLGVLLHAQDQPYAVRRNIDTGHDTSSSRVEPADPDGSVEAQYSRSPVANLINLAVGTRTGTSTALPLRAGH